MTGGDGYRGDITEHRLAGRLFAEWNSGTSASRAALEHEPPPGPIALRSRLRHLIDAAHTGTPISHVTTTAWNDAITAETRGDDAVRRGEFPAAEAEFRRVLADHGDWPVAAANACIGIGDVSRANELTSEAVAAYQTAINHSRPAGYRFGELRALTALGHLTLNHHSVAAATDRFTDALRLAEALEDPVYLGNCQLGLAECAEREDRIDDAIAGYRQAFDTFAKIRTTTGQAHAAERLGALLHRGKGDLHQAREWFVTATRIFTDDGDAVGAANCLAGLGDIMLQADDHDGAESMYQESRTVALAHRLPRAAAHAIQNLGRVAQARGDLPQAEQLFAEAVHAYRDLPDLLGVCTALDRLAVTRKHLGKYEAALRDRVSAVFVIEQYRAAHTSPAAQHEYRVRFRSIYAKALYETVAAGAVGDFAVVADSLAGRRLVGLALADAEAADADETDFLQNTLVRADQRWLSLGREPGTGGMQLPADVGKQERLTRMLGALALKSGLVDPAEAALDELLSALYPLPQDGDELLTALPPGCHVLQVLPDPDDGTAIYWLWRSVTGAAKLGRTRLPQPCISLLELLQGASRRRAELAPNDVEALSELLTEELRQCLVAEPGQRLLLLPVGELWLVPWGAIPLGGTVLGELTEFVVCPSLGLQRVVRNRGAAASPDSPAMFWHSSLITYHRFERLLEDRRWDLAKVASASEAKTRLGSGTHTAIIVCHGRLAPGLGHYLELDVDDWLLPVDVFRAAPPQRLYLITCWGAGVPGTAMTDPISVATLALAKGSSEVLASVGEFGDSPVADDFAHEVISRLGDGRIGASAALRQVVGELMSEPEYFDRPLGDWAQLLPIGTFHG
ncbi:tetratricopeptide repeat protein [Amycolatopsis sp. NBC_01286]|uniref:tetratricopeptide repeat protein n=1 Tax=Amycolatopsis sp. NBC_01286 TaxID=2903560 RepID=UPI002E1507D4|nr:CHAT domain-containing protein [Amycolatopsis sp. NBC_01286]